MKTRQDFEREASLISRITKQGEKLLAYTQAVKAFKKSNPRFNVPIFKKACGL